MPTTNQQSQIAFKNLGGKSQVNDLSSVVSENYGWFLNVPTTNIWSTRIPTNDPTKAVNDGIAVEVVADLETLLDSGVQVGSSQFFQSYRAKWSSTAPTGIDPKTNADFAFGAGSLKDVAAGQPIYDFIPSSYGKLFEIIPYTGDAVAANQISIGDDREWVFQYPSGIFYQSKVGYTGYVPPNKIRGYFYIGDKLSNFDTGSPDIIRVSATGPDTGIYYATTSIPIITTYSLNHLYLIDFSVSNTQSVKLNIDSNGTYSVYKWGATGLQELSFGDIVGATGSTAGQIYYLTWNEEKYFQFYLSNPTPAPNEYKNLARIQNSVGGIKTGESFDGVKLENMLNNILYNDIYANWTSIGITHANIQPTSDPRLYLTDLGRSLTGLLTFSWGYTNLTDFKDPFIRIMDSTVLSGLPTVNWPAGTLLPKPFQISTNTGTFSVTFSISTTTERGRFYEFWASDGPAKRLNNTYLFNGAEIRWTWRAYYGSSTYGTLNGRGVTALASQLMTQSVGTFHISGTQGYKYIAFPDLPQYNFTNITYYNLPVVLATESYSLVDNGNNYTTLTVTNSYNVGTSYRLYRTMNQINGTLSVNITK